MFTSIHASTYMPSSGMPTRNRSAVFRQSWLLSKFEQYMGRCPKITIQGRSAGLSGVLASWGGGVVRCGRGMSMGAGTLGNGVLLGVSCAQAIGVTRDEKYSE